MDLCEDIGIPSPSDVTSIQKRHDYIFGEKQCQAAGDSCQGKVEMSSSAPGFLECMLICVCR